MPKFSDLTLKNFSPPDRGQMTYHDDQSPLAIRVSQRGTKTFIVTLGSGRRFTIGRYGIITLAEARQTARRLKAERTLGRIIPSAVAFSEARGEYLAQITVRPNTRRYYVRWLNKLKAAKLSDITPRDIYRILDQLPAPSGNQALASFSAFFTWCQRRHYIDRNPCELITIRKTKSRSRVLSDDELRRIWNAAEHLDQYGMIVKLLILTGQRRNEIASIQPSWLQKDTLVIPASVAKNGREHVVPLTTFSAKLLTTLPMQRFTLWSYYKKKLDDLSGANGYCLHDLRRTCASNMARLGVQLPVIEKLLNHVSASFGGIVGVYQRYDFMPEMRDAVYKYELWLTNLLSS